MAYKFTQYGDGFKILGKYEGWHYGIWIDCMPKSFVFLKPINDNDYVFTCVDSIKAHYIDRFCGRIELICDHFGWDRLDIEIVDYELDYAETKWMSAPWYCGKDICIKFMEEHKDYLDITDNRSAQCPAYGWLEE